MDDRNDNRTHILEQIATEALGLLGSGQQVAPFGSRAGGLSVADAYAVVTKLRDLRKARGETPVGLQDRLHQPQHLADLWRQRTDLELHVRQHRALISPQAAACLRSTAWRNQHDRAGNRTDLARAPQRGA